MICSLHWKPVGPRMPKCCYFWQIFMLKLIFLHKYRLDFFHQVGSRTLNFLRNIGLNHQFYFCIGILMDHKCQNCLWYGPFLVLELVFLLNNWFHVFFQGVNLKLSTCFGILRWKLLMFFVESWWIKNAKEKRFYSWHAWKFKFVFILCSTCFVFSSRSQSI